MSESDRRTIYQLLVADAAGEPLSLDEQEQLRTHSERLSRLSIDAYQLLGPEEREQIPFGQEHDALLARLRHRAETTDEPTELRGLVHALIGLFELSGAFVARQEGRFRRERRDKTRGARQTADIRQDERNQLQKDLDDIRTASPTVKTLTDAALRHLQKTDPAFDGLTRAERAKKADNLLRRLRGRKKTGQC